jgi:translocation and assembly module TamB
VSYGDIALDNLTMTGTTNFHRADYKIDADGRYHGMVNVSTAGTVDWDKPEKHIDIETLSGMHGKTAIALAKPASLILSDTGLEVRPTTLQIGDGHVGLSFKRDRHVLQGHVDLAEFPLNVIRAFTSEGPAAGKLTGTADVSLGPDGPSGSARFQVASLALSPGDAAPDRLDGTLNAEWHNSSLSLKGDFTGQGDAKIALNAAMPLHYVADTGAFDLPETGRLTGDVTWNADIGPFWNAFGPDTQTLQGRVNASLKLDGTVGDPSATGDITLHDGRYVNLEMGTVLDDLALRLEANRREVRLVEASATDGGSGKVTASGMIGLDPEGHFPIKLDVTADKAKLVRRTDVTATASGNLSFTKDGKSSLLQGKIKTDRVDATLVDMSSPDVINLKVTEIGPDGMVIKKPETEAPEASESATKLDIDVDVPGQAFIRGRGLDSEWKGKLKVTGALVDPQIVGTFNVVRGNFKFAGRTFDLQRGQVSFQGGRKIDPDLNVEAAYGVQDLTATVQITGPSSAPKVILSSTPSYPQDEILSRILFGSSVADLTPLQAVQLADAVRGLGKPGGGLLGSARNVVGLDVLQVGSSQPGGGIESTTITGGKYIAKNIYLEAQAAPDGSQEQVGVDVGLTKHLSVQSEVSPQQGSRVGLKWKRDY